MPFRLPRARPLYLGILFGVFSALVACAVAASEVARGARERTPGEKLTFTLEHSIDGKTFTATGVVHSKLAVDRSDARNFRLSAPKAERERLSESDAEKLNALAKAGGTYRVRAPSDLTNSESGKWVMASVDARCLLDGGLEDVLTVHADDRGRAYGIEYATARGGCGGERNGGAEQKVKTGAMFLTTVQVRVGKDAPGLNPNAPTDVRGHSAPATGKQKEAEKRREAERLAKERRDGAMPPSEKRTETFFQKHWMRIMLMAYVAAYLCAPQDANARAGAQRRLDAMKAKKRQ